jgi:hypothetical protein
VSDPISAKQLVALEVTVSERLAELEAENEELRAQLDG